MSATAGMVPINEHIGQWQVMLLLLLGCNYAIVGINHTLPAFQGYTPHYFCQVDNVTTTVQECVTQINSSEVQTEPSCPRGYQFESSRGDWTVVTEWQLVCERRFLRPLIATLYFCGVTLGAIICGLLADHYGRRPVLLVCLYAQGLLGASLYFIQTLESFMGLRFVQGFFVQGLQGTTFTLLVELFPPRFRTAVGVVLELYWALGLVYLAGASYYIPKWRTLELILSIPTAATLLYVCLVPESARWLVIRGRVEEAQKIWKRILPSYQNDLPKDTNSTKNITDELKCAVYDGSPSSQNKNANKQPIINNDMIQIEINSIPIYRSDSEDRGTDTGMQLLVEGTEHGEDDDRVTKQQMSENRLKGNVKDCSKLCDNSSIGIDHIRIMPNHICHVENRSSNTQSEQDVGNSDISKDSDSSTKEISYSLSCGITHDCKEEINVTDREKNKENIKLIKHDEIPDFTAVHNSHNSMLESDFDQASKTEISPEGSKKTLKGCSLDVINSDDDDDGDSIGNPCSSGIRKEIDDTWKSKESGVSDSPLAICRSRSKSDGLNYLWTEMAQELMDGEEESTDGQSVSGRADKTSAQYERRGGVCIKKTFVVDDDKVNAISVTSACRIVVSGDEGEIVHADEIAERNSINMTEDTPHCRDERRNISVTDLDCDDVVIYSQVAKRCKILERKILTDTPKMVEKGTSTKRTGFFELFKSPILRKYNLIMIFVWFSVSLLYYGIMFHLPDLSGERHLNFLLGAVVEVLSYVLAYIILSRYGRRRPMASFLLLSGFICIIVGAISVVPEEDAHWIGQTQTALALVGKGAVVSGFCTMFIYASELFPTVLRGAAMGHCGFWGRVGSLIAPQLLFLGEYTLSAVPLVIMGLLGMLAGLLVFALPETLGQHLPDTVEEVEMRVRNKRQVHKTAFT